MEGKVLKIIDVKVIPVNQFLFVKGYTDEGITGIGESGAWGFLKASGAIIDTLFRDYLIGKDPLEIEKHWQFLLHANYFRGAALMGALSAVDVALWDIAGKYYNVPIYKLLGGKVRDKIRTYSHVRGKTLPELLERCQESVEQGYTAVGHLCPFLDEPMDQIYDKTFARKISDAVNVVRSVRETLGDDVDLCIECSRYMNPAEAIVLGNEIEPFHPYFYEDPIRPDNFDAMAEVARNIHIPIATGERIHGPQEFMMLVNHKALKFLRADVTLCGGITGLKKIAAIAEANELQIVPHNPCSPVCTAASVHVDASSASFAIQEYPNDTRTRRQPGTGETFPLNEIVTDIIKCENGYLMVPDAPGLGVDLVEDADKKFPYDQYPIRMRMGIDGGFVY